MNIEKKEKYLLIVGEGVKREFAELVEGSKVILNAVQNANCNLVLADYRNVRFEMDQTQAFNIIRHYEGRMQTFNSIAAAVVLGEENLGIGEVWSRVASARGFNFKIFSDYAEAERWILSQPG